MDQPDDEIAARRFWMLQVLRLSGVVLVVLGAMVVAGTLDWPQVAGYVLIAVGIADFFVMPLLLARRWSSPGE